MHTLQQKQYRPLAVLLTTLILLVLNKPLSAAEDHLATARVHGAIGETGHLFLVTRGLHGRPLYNDIFGQTDKHLSGATQLGYVGSEAGFSFELLGSWRFLTPCFREDFSKDPLLEPVGRYADWMELQAAASRVVSWNGYRLRFQGGLGYGDISDKGARRVHRSIHAKVGSTLEGLEYINQPNGIGLSRNLEAGIIQDWKLLPDWNISTLVNLGYSRNLMVEETYANFNALLAPSDSWSLGAELNLIQHQSSRAYADSILSNRWEAAFGFRWKAWRPSVKYVSPFLKGDQVGQLYFDPLAFVFEF